MKFDFYNKIQNIKLEVYMFLIIIILCNVLVLYYDYILNYSELMLTHYIHITINKSSNKYTSVIKKLQSKECILSSSKDTIQYSNFSYLPYIRTFDGGHEKDNSTLFQNLAVKGFSLIYATK